MKQMALFQRQTNQKQQPLKFSKDMTIKGKKNSKIKIVSNRYRHNYWGNIFQRKRVMSEYFSDSAFGSQSDTKIEFICIMGKRRTIKETEIQTHL